VRLPGLQSGHLRARRVERDWAGHAPEECGVADEIAASESSRLLGEAERPLEAGAVEGPRSSNSIASPRHSPRGQAGSRASPLK
jgi:hypothetical protein